MADVANATVRLLDASDEPAFRTFLAPRAPTSMFLLSNSRAAGLVDQGKPLQATYAGAFTGDTLIGVVAHGWNGMMLVQAPLEVVTTATLGELLHTALAASHRELTGFSGPADQVAAARAIVPLPRAPSLDSNESLYALVLADLEVPAALASGSVTCRPPAPSELPQLASWRRDYELETLGAVDSDDLARKCRRAIDDLAARRQLWILEAAGAIVAMTGFNASIPELVQVGGVYTPPSLRNRGHARCAVAGSLLAVRVKGVERAILFTNSPQAARAYQALGFVHIGSYALVIA